MGVIKQTVYVRFQTDGVGTHHFGTVRGRLLIGRGEPRNSSLGLDSPNVPVYLAVHVRTLEEQAGSFEFRRRLLDDLEGIFLHSFIAEEHLLSRVGQRLATRRSCRPRAKRVRPGSTGAPVPAKLAFKVYLNEYTLSTTNASPAGQRSQTSAITAMAATAQINALFLSVILRSSLSFCSNYSIL